MNTNQNNSLYCGVCYKKYSSERLPVCLPQCGHTFCKGCTNNVLWDEHRTPNCPFCKKNFIFLANGAYVKPQTNYALLDVLQKLSPGVFGLCAHHCMPHEYICIKDKEYACKECCIFGHHQSHKVIKIEDVKRERDEKISMLEVACRLAKACLPKILAKLDKRQQEDIERAEEAFLRLKVKGIKEEQRLEWIMKITQAYEEERLRVIMGSLQNVSIEKAAERELEEYKIMDLEEICAISKEEVQRFIDKNVKDLVSSNTATYCYDLMRVSEQLHEFLTSIQYSLEPKEISFPDLTFPSIFRNEDVKIASCLCFEFFGNTLTITIQKNQNTINIRNVENWKQIEKINWSINDIGISDDDCELLRTILSHLNQVQDIEISFGPEILASFNMINFQKHVINLMKIFFINTKKLTHLTLIWNGAYGAEIALEDLKCHLLDGLNLETLKIRIPNTQIINPIWNMSGRFKTAKTFNSPKIRELLLAFKDKTHCELH